MLEDNKVVALVLKEVNKPDNVWVLAHLKDVDLSPWLVDLDDFHVPLSSSFESNSLTSLNVRALEHFAKLTLTDCLAI